METLTGIFVFIVFVSLYAGGAYSRKELAPIRRLTPKQYGLCCLLGFIPAMALLFPIIDVFLTFGGGGLASLSLVALSVEQGLVIPERVSRLFPQ